MYFKYFPLLVTLFFWLCLWKFLAHTHTYTHISEWITACFMSLMVYLVGIVSLQIHKILFFVF